VEQITKYISNQIPSGMTQGTGTLMSDLFVGDFNQLLIGQRLGLSIQTLTERYAELGQIGIIAHWRGDIQLARPRAFSVYRFLKGV
jgi:HK97 family phage major capsid protein